MDAHWLVLALTSLATQTRTDFECILVDSSPTDEIAEVAERFQDRLSLRIERRPDLVGWQRKTCFGVALARAEHVSMLHPDDLWEPQRAVHIKRWLDAEPDAVMHLHPSWVIDKDGRRVGMLRCPYRSDVLLGRREALERLIVQNFISVCAPVIRRDAFAQLGIDFDLWYTGDWDLYLKLAAIGPVLYHDDPLACYRVHGNAMTIAGSRNIEDFRQQLQLVLDRHLPLIDSEDASHVAARARASVLVNTALAAALHGRRGALLTALWSIVRLGPLGIVPFFRDTRLLERLLPRLRSRIRVRSA